MANARLGVDVGGTFTDLVCLDDGELISAKVPSTPTDQSHGVMRSIEAAGVDPSSVGVFAHGMTVATNALLERRGARTAMITTEGFRDIIEIGRQNRPSLYDLTEDRPPPLVPRPLRFTVRERMGPDGELIELDQASLEQVVTNIERAGVEAVAVCLLFSFLHPEHERRVAEKLRDRLKGVHVSLSSEVLPEFREFERFATTTTDAYLAPKLAAYLGRLAEKVRSAGVAAPHVMQSSGGVVELASAVDHAVGCVLSGPAGGVVGAAFVAEAAGYRDVLTFDMGGTSTDVAPIVGGQVVTTTESVVAGIPIKAPMVDVHSVSAGGGSIAWVDEGGALRVGPRSAGADPGPAAYGLGGENATVTDADLFLGYLADGAQLGGELRLRRELAEQALRTVGDRAGMDPTATALGIVEIANVEMSRALRLISVERGLDPRGFALVSFGGAGPMHSCALAEELGITTVLVPRASGVLSALGLAISDTRRDYVAPYPARLDEMDASVLEETFRGMEGRAKTELKTPTIIRRADLRYAGQSFELTVSADSSTRLADSLHEAHEQRYGYRMSDASVEIVNLRVVATVFAEKPDLLETAARQATTAGRRRGHFEGEWIEVVVHDRAAMGTGSKVKGPCVVEMAESTCVVRPGWSGTVDGSGTLILESGS